MLKVIVLEEDQQCRETIMESLGQSYGIHFLPREGEIVKEFTSNHYDAAILGLQGQNGDTFNNGLDQILCLAGEYTATA